MKKAAPLHWGDEALVGYGDHHRDNPHLVDRPGGVDVWLLEFSHEGRAVVAAPDGERVIEADSVVVFRPATPQHYRMDDRVGFWRHTWFCFTPRPHWLALLDWPELSAGVGRLRLPRGRARTYLTRRMAEAVDLSRGPQIRRRDLVLNILEETLLWLDGVNPRREHGRLDARIRAAMQHICDNAGRRMTLASLAAACSLSPSRLSHLFRREVGMTPMTYLQQRRVELARELLVMSAASIKQISARVGYDNPFYFSRVFRSFTGRSPSEFRRAFGGRHTAGP